MIRRNEKTNIIFRASSSTSNPNKLELATQKQEPYDWMVDQHRDTYCTYEGRQDLLTHFAVARGKSKARPRSNYQKKTHTAFWKETLKVELAVSNVTIKQLFALFTLNT